MIKETIYVAINHTDEIQWIKGSFSKTRYFRTDKYLKTAVEYHNKYHPEDIWKVRKCSIVEETESMTREEAIKQLKGDITESCATFSNQWEKDEEAISVAISALSDYDKMQEISLDLAFENDELINKSRWIPVSERLPEQPPDRVDEQGQTWFTPCGDVLVCMEDGKVFQACITYNERKFWSGNSITGKINPIAWMPLPKPYKAESEGAND